MTDIDKNLHRLIDLVVDKIKRKRFYDLANAVKRRGDLINDLCHDRRYLINSKLREIKHTTNVNKVIQELSGKGGDRFYCIGHVEGDGQVVNLPDIFPVIYGMGNDVMLISTTRNFGYYENHEYEKFYID